MKKLFCIPGGGTSCVMYLPWNRLFKPEYDICPLEIPGRGYKDSKPALDDLCDIVEELTQEIKKAVGDEKYSIFGYCFGGLLAYEVSRRLEAMGEKTPENVYICGSTCPEPKDDAIQEPMLKRENCRAELRKMLYRFFPPYLFTNSNQLRETCEKYMDCMLGKYDEYGNIMPVTVDELDLSDEDKDNRSVKYIIKFANSFFTNYMHDERAAVKYYYTDKAAQKLKTPLTLVCGRYDTVIGTSWNEWKNWAENIRDIKILETNHFTLTQDPKVIYSIIRESEN